MKKLFTLFAVAFLVQSCGMEQGNGNIIEEERTVGTFNELVASGSIDVALVSGKDVSVKVISDENIAPLVVTEVKDGILNIHFKKGERIGKNSTQVVVSFPTLNTITSSGSGNITCNGAIENNQTLEVKSSGSGNVQLEVNTPALKVNGSGSGDFHLAGLVRDADLNINGSGDIDAENLLAESAEVKTTGSGNIKVHASNSLKAVITGSGNILYWGNPSLNEVKVSGSGTIKAGQ